MSDRARIAQERDEQTQPGSVVRGQRRDVDRVGRSLVLAQLADGGLQHVAVDIADQAELFDHRHELRRRNDRAVALDHAQQTLVMLHSMTARLDDGLIGEDQAVRLQRAHHLLGDLDMLAAVASLFLAALIVDEGQAAPLLRLAPRDLGLGHHVMRGLPDLREDDAADRHLEMDRAARRYDRRVVARRDQLLHNGGELLFGAIADHDAKTIGPHPADDIAGADRALDALAKREHRRIGGRAVIGVVDHGERVDRHLEIGAAHAVALAIRHRLIQRFAQADLVEMAGQLIIVGLILQARLVGLALGDHAQRAGQPLRLADRRQRRRTALMNPDHLAAIAADAVLAIERSAGGDVLGEGPPANQQILGIDQTVKLRACIDVGGAAEAEHIGDAAGPRDRIGGQIPVIGKVAGARDCITQELNFRLDPVVFESVRHYRRPPT
ncbi:MAG: hypothetical protein P8Z76_14395 [Alphaproteobacteria bacterium]